MKKQIVLSLFLILINQLVAQPSISITSFGTGFNKPVNIKHAGDDRLFIVEQDGYIQILNANGTVNSTPFLDIESMVGGSGVIGDERGFLGLAFHPNYATNGFFYVNYTNTSGDSVISRFSVSSSNSNLADSGSESNLLTISQPAGNHNGGDMAFGADGYLYISSGDGGGSGDPTDQGQELESLLGKILRIDVNTTSGGNNYGIPTDNPFVSNANAYDEIWAYGLRNPWKFSFDSQTNDIWIADVGQGGFEEINMMPSTAAGINYGWRCYEGNQAFNTADCTDISTMTFPVAIVPHSGTSFCSITGGYRYRGTQYSVLSGLYFFADYCSTQVGVLTPNGSNWDMDLTSFSGKNWVAFGEDLNGELYVADITGGEIFKIISGTLGLDNELSTDFKMYPNPVNDELTFEFKNTANPEKITFYDIQGRLIKHVEDFPTNFLTISVQNFKKGFYFLEILDASGKKASKRLIIN